MTVIIGDIIGMIIIGMIKDLTNHRVIGARMAAPRSTSAIDVIDISARVLGLMNAMAMIAFGEKFGVGA